MGAMNAEELAKYKGVFVFAQQVDNKLSGIAFELVGEGSRLAEKLGTEVTAVLLGSGVAGLADELAEYGADKCCNFCITSIEDSAWSHVTSFI